MLWNGAHSAASKCPTLLDELSALMRDASICGLGQAAPNPLLCVLKYFPDELTKPLGHW